MIEQIFIESDGVVYPMENVRGRIVRFGRVGEVRSRVRTVQTDVGESLTVQSAKDDTDLNVIMERFKRGVALPELRPGMFGDVREMNDFMAVQDKRIEAEALFMKLPARMREQFDNNVAVFMDYIADDRNVEEGIEIGLYKKPDPPVEGAGGAPPAPAGGAPPA